MLEGLRVQIDGTGDEMILMLHGWPDTGELWEDQVAALKGEYRCVRLTLPGFDLSAPRRPVSLDEMVGIFRSLIEKESPDRPVVLMMHDWGCVFGFHFAMQHPDLVSRVIGMDVGDANSDAHVASLGLAAKAMVFAYQSWLALAWRVGGRLGDAMTRGVAKLLGAPAAPESIGSSMNYPYDMVWMKSYGSLEHVEIEVPPMPTLFFWGSKKPFQFFSKTWASAIDARADSRVVRVEAGHWLMKEQCEQVNGIMKEWLSADALPKV
ncbi:MAG: alpha/beta fold hydrolase [Myxococcota bacterium]